MSFMVLWRQKRRARNELEKFALAEENCRRQVLGMPPLVDRVTRIRKSVGRFWPPLLPRPRRAPRNAYERIFTAGTKENDLFRTLSTVIACECVGLFFFVTIAIKYATYPSRLGALIGIIVQVIMGFMLAFPVLRAVVLIAVPNLATSKFRSVLLLFIISWSFQSPAMNTTRNLQSVAESVACIRDRIVDSANDFIEETNRQANRFSIGNLKSNAGFLLVGLDRFIQLLKKLQDAVLKYAKNAKLFLKQMVTVKGQCQRFFIGPYYICLKIFSDAANLVEDIVWYNSALITRPLNRMKATCEVARFAEQICVIPSAIKGSLREGYLSFILDRVKTVVDVMIRHFNYRFWMAEAKGFKHNWEEMKISLEHSMEANKTRSFNLERLQSVLKSQLEQYAVFVSLVSYAVAFAIFPLLLLPFVRAGIFAYSYKHGEKVENVFITEEFRKIDLLREAQGQPTLLPLLPKELETYIDGHSLRKTSREKLLMFSYLGLTLIGGLVPVILVLLDVFTYNMIYHSYVFFRSNITRTDRIDHYKMQVSGEGFAAGLLKRVLEIFSPLAGGGAHDEDWRNCFTEPQPPDYLLFQMMFLFYVICLFLCFIQPYVERYRVTIAEHYWPFRSRPRALYLYSQILEARKAILSQILLATKAKALKEQLAEDELLGRTQIINRGLPILTSDQYECVRCGRPDLSFMDARNAMICPNCNDLYCADCYSISAKCLSCGASLQILMKNVELYIDSSCDEDEFEETEVAEDDQVAISNVTKTTDESAVPLL